MARGGVVCPTPLSMLGFNLAWTCACCTECYKFICTAALKCPEVFPYPHLLSLAPTLLLPPLPQWFLSLEGRGVLNGIWHLVEEVLCIIYSVWLEPFTAGSGISCRFTQCMLLAGELISCVSPHAALCAKKGRADKWPHPLFSATSLLSPSC